MRLICRRFSMVVPANGINHSERQPSSGFDASGTRLGVRGVEQAVD